MVLLFLLPPLVATLIVLNTAKCTSDNLASAEYLPSWLGTSIAGPPLTTILLVLVLVACVLDYYHYPGLYCGKYDVCQFDEQLY